MTAKKLIEELQKYPGGTEVVLYHEDLDFTHFPAEYVKLQNVRFCEDPDDPNREPFTDEECIVISGD